MVTAEKAILTTAYLPPIQYIRKLLNYKTVIIEQYDHYTKQTYRNRCEILGANGILPLSIPVKKKATKTYTKDIKIDYDTNWQKIHWKSIESAYRSSPFFEFYEEDLRPFYNNKYKFLIDYNLDVLEFILDALEIDVQIKLTSEFESNYAINDFRETFHPKKKQDPSTTFLTSKKVYFQVFSDKYGFVPGLSIIDLLFNEGSNAPSYLK